MIKMRNMNKIKKYPALIISGLLILVIAGLVISQGITYLQIGHLKEMQGEIEWINITLTNLTNGLSGYNITITIENISIAEILDVSFPYWATLHSNASLPSNSIWIKAVDLQDKINGSMDKVLLARIAIRGIANGETRIVLQDNQLDDDNGNAILPAREYGYIKIIQIQYTLKTSVSPSGAGSITLNPSGGKYDEGTVVTGTAVANSGYVFDHWGGDASGTNPTIQITMDENKSIVAYFVAIPSNSPPTITITSPSNGATVSGTVTIQGTAADSDGTLQKVEVKIDNGTWQQATGTTSWSYSLDTTSLSNGEHVIYARSFDGTDYSSSASITINIFNNHNPIIVIVSPENGSIVKGTIVVNGTASDEDGNDTITKVEIRIDNGTWNVANGTISWNYTINTKELKNGMHVIYARAYDGHDYSNISSIQIDVKNEKKTPGFEIVLLFASVMIIYFLKRKQY